MLSVIPSSFFFRKPRYKEFFIDIEKKLHLVRRDINLTPRNTRKKDFFLKMKKRGWGGGEE